MDLSLTLPRSVVVAVSMLACSLIHAETASNRVVDLRYGIPTWHQPLGVPDDWHKPMANERGALLYDFGPGPYVQPSTSVQATAAGEAFKFERQEWVDSPRRAGRALNPDSWKRFNPGHDSRVATSNGCRV